MSGHDLKTKRAIGIDPGETDDERHHSRVTFCAALAAATGRQQIGFEEVAAFLAVTQTRLVSVAVEDVLALDDQVNVPGTVGEHPNWRRRWPIVLEELSSDQRMLEIAATFSRAGRSAKPVS